MLKKILHLFKRSNRPRKTYRQEINDAIVRSNFLGITQTTEIELLKSLPADRETYQQILELIKTSSVDEVKKMTGSDMIFEDLSVVKFKAHGKSYIATVFDSFEIFQGLIVIDIFPVKE